MDYGEIISALISAFCGEMVGLSSLWRDLKRSQLVDSLGHDYGSENDNAKHTKAALAKA